MEGRHCHTQLARMHEGEREGWEGGRKPLQQGRGEIKSTLNTSNTLTSLYTVITFCLFVLPRVGSMDTGDPNPITSTVARVEKKKKSYENYNPG